MSLANDLINSLAKAGVETEEDLTTLVIDHYTRTINIPKGITTLGVESDDDVLRLNFKMPRYLGTVDLYNFNIRINYINANGEDDVYQVTDKVIADDYIMFSWLVGPTATAYKGITKFNVCMVITDANSVIKQEYNTTIASLPVLQGLECSERVVSDYTDILEQWERRLFGIGDTEEANLVTVSEQQQTAIANKGEEVLATIPAEYQATVKMAEEGARTKADAIIRTAEGETIIVNDSSDDYLRGLKIFGKTTQAKTSGKNLLKVTATSSTINGITYTVNADGSIRANGTATDDAFLTVGTMTYVGGTEYEISGCPSNGNMNTYTLYAVYGDGLYAFDIGSGKTYTPATDMTKTVSIRVTKGVTVSNLVYWPMVRLASNADDIYEIYTGGAASPSPDYPQELASIENPTLTIYGKNLLDDTQLVYHPEYTDTYSSALAVLDYKVYKGKTYTLSFDTENTGTLMYVNPNSGFTYAQFTMDGTRHSFTTTMTKDVVNSTYTMALVSIATSSNVACGRISNVQIELGSEATAYEPYTEAQTIVPVHALPGIPVTSGGNYTDANGRQWICDEIDFDRGVYIKRVDSASGLTFNIADDTGYPVGNSLMYYAVLPGKLAAFTTRHRVALCNKLPYDTDVLNNDVNGFYPLNARVYARIEGVSDVDTFNTIMSDATFLVALEPAVETPLTADEIAAYKALRTNCPNTTVINDAGAQMELVYNADTELWLENKLAERLPRNHYVAPAITETATGEVVAVSDSSDDYVRGLRLYGKTTQNGTPTPEAPVKLVSAGDSGSVRVNVGGTNLLKLEQFYVQNANGLTISLSDNVLILNGTATGTVDIYVLSSSSNPTSLNLLNRMIGSTVRMNTNLGLTCYWNDGSSYAQNVVTIGASGIRQAFVRIPSGASYTNTKLYINVSIGADVTEYKPYKEPLTLAVSTPNALPGIPVATAGNYTDANGQQWICDEIDFARGKYVQRVKKVVLDGSSDEVWQVNAANTTDKKRHVAVLDNIVTPINAAKMPVSMCSHYAPLPAQDTWRCITGISLQVWGEPKVAALIYDPDFAEATSAEWKAHLAQNPITCLFQFVTPIETDLTAEELAAYVKLHTNYPSTIVYNDANAGQEVTYVADTKNWIKNQFK